MTVPSLYGSRDSQRRWSSAAWAFAERIALGAQQNRSRQNRIAYVWCLALAPIDIPAEVRREAHDELQFHLAMSGAPRGLRASKPNTSRAWGVGEDHREPVRTTGGLRGVSDKAADCDRVNAAAPARVGPRVATGGRSG